VFQEGTPPLTEQQHNMWGKKTTPKVPPRRPPLKKKPGQLGGPTPERKPGMEPPPFYGTFPQKQKGHKKIGQKTNGCKNRGPIQKVIQRCARPKTWKRGRIPRCYKEDKEKFNAFPVENSTTVLAPLQGLQITVIGTIPPSEGCVRA